MIDRSTVISTPYQLCKACAVPSWRTSQFLVHWRPDRELFPVFSMIHPFAFAGIDRLDRPAMDRSIAQLTCSGARFASSQIWCLFFSRTHVSLID